MFLTFVCSCQTQGKCFGGGASRARFGSQPRGEALPTAEELRELEADIRGELDALNAERGDRESVVANMDRARAARVATMSELNP